MASYWISQRGLAKDYRDAMMRVLSFLAALFFAGSAFADQIDVVLKFADRPTAIADATAVLDTYVDADGDGLRHFLPNHVIENVKVWRASQDVGGVHTYLAGWFCLISLPSEQAAKLAPLQNHPAVTVVINRDKANAGQVGAIIRSTVSNAILQDLRMSPVFAGSDYPWGAWQ